MNTEEVALAGEGEAHFASNSIQKKQLVPPAISNSAIAAKVDQSKAFAAQPGFELLHQEPRAQFAQQNDKYTPKTSPKAAGTEPIEDERFQFREVNAQSRAKLVANGPGVTPALSQMQTGRGTALPESEISKQSEFRNTANTSGLTPGMSKKQLQSAGPNKHYTRETAEPPLSKTAYEANEMQFDIRSLNLGNTTSKKLAY